MFKTMLKKLHELREKFYAFMRRMEPSPECPYCGFLIHGPYCDACGGDPNNVLVREGSNTTISCHRCGRLIDDLDGPFSCDCR